MQHIRKLNQGVDTKRTPGGAPRPLSTRALQECEQKIGTKVKISIPRGSETRENSLIHIRMTKTNEACKT